MSNQTQDQNNYQNIISEIESRLQFITTIAIFFPAMVYYFFNAMKDSKYDSTEVTLGYTILVGAYLLDYVIFEIKKNKLSEKYLRYINRSLLFGIAFFIVPIIVMASKIYELSPILGFVLPLSLLGVLITPLFISMIFLSNILMNFRRTIK